jgi:hypothetical protein
MTDDPPAGVPGPEEYQPRIVREPHPEVVRWVEYVSSWPADKLFPLTPLEAWYVLQGFTVKPAASFTFEEFLQFPGMIEGGPDGLCLRQV